MSRLVSVVVPTRDRPELLRQALASALGQTHCELEVVVVDDGSRAPVTVDFDRVRLVRLDDPVGPGAARNAGVDAARGSLIAFLDDDDEWDARKLERQLAALAASPGAAAVECGYELYDGARLVLRYVPDTRVDFRRALLEPLTPCLQPSTVLVDRAAFEELGGFDPAFPCREDHELWLRLADRFPIASVEAVLVRRRLNHDFPRRETLDGYRALVSRLQPRLETLAPEEAARLRASYALHQAVLESAAGERRRALATLLGGWRQRPASPRAAANLARIVAGERAWARARRAMPSRAALRRA